MRRCRSIGKGRPLASLIAAILLGTVPVAQAAPPPLAVPVSSQDVSAGGQRTFSGYLSSLERSNYLFGDLFGLRTALSKIGISVAFQETSEVIANATGGTSTQPAYDGLTQMIMQLDTQRAFGWYGGLFNVSGLQLHGYNLSANNLLQYQTASGISGDPATRLWELWYQQKFLPEDRLDIRVGQQSLDQEFMVSQNGLYFMNTMFGWPMIPSAVLPGGGPAYPLSALGARVRYRPVNSVTGLFGIYNGSPTWTSEGDAQKLNPSGTYFGTGDGVIMFFELQFAYPSLGALEEPGSSGPPRGHTYKIGAWYNSLGFNDLRYDNTGLSLANPNTTGVPKTHSGNYSIYAVADQILWVQGSDPARSLSAFARVMWAPLADRSVIDFSMNAGLVYHDPLPNRPDDILALGMGYAHVSSAASGLDADTIFYNQQAGTPVNQMVRRSETFVELTYIAQVRPWWQIQPDFQYVFNPGGGIVNPNNPTQAVGNEFIVAMRTNILF
ncbi:porin [Enhydrobacter aerosaccus]|uniref:Porin n=1 Tax=Enhydrobacter aerosaccus TaxID=225324 RepID=A0A1T4TKS0_9HYPH|nr:carbohydrate porin [Enhydrobacter aerosaccus]SKA40839.1 porin [Enhydrobacter aerosaccus]